MTEIRLKPRYFLWTLAGIVTLLMCAHAGIQLVRFALGDDRVFGLVALLSVGAESNVPAYYSTFSLLLCALLSALIAVASRQHEHGDTGYWIGLALVFAFLSADENMSLHEHLIEPLRTSLDTSGLFYYAWVIPYGIGALLFATLYMRFLLRLPRRTAILFVVAGAIFVAGAIGLEMIGGLQSQAHGNATPAYVILQSLEELFEMGGIVVFVYALVDYIDRRFGTIRLAIGGS